MTENGFTTGAKVVVDTGRFGKRVFRVDEVLKVHKTGHFTLKSDPSQQWRPNKRRAPYSGFREAHQTGQGYGGRMRAVLIEPASEKWAREVLAGQKHRSRVSALRSRLEALTPGDVTAEALEMFERALELCEPKKEDPK